MSTIKSKRFRLNKLFDMAFMRCMSASGARIASHGKMEEKFQGMLEMFFAKHKSISKSNEIPPLKTENGTRPLYWSSQRTAMQGEECGEIEELIDSIIKKVDEKNCARTEEKQEQTE